MKLLLRCGLALFLLFSLIMANAVSTCQTSLSSNRQLPAEVIRTLSPLNATYLKTHGQTLFFDADSPVVGNPKGEVTLIDFFDYQCGYCKRVSPVLIKLASTYPNLRVVFKELPLFGDESEQASLAAIASAKYGKYVGLHERLMRASSLSSSRIAALTQEMGLTQAQLASNKKMASSELARNLKLMDSLNLVGTPSFVIARIQPNQLESGKYDAITAYYVTSAVSANELKELVKQFIEKC